VKQVLQARSGRTVVRDVPAPPCPPGAVLVRNEYSVISTGTERSRVALSQKSLLGKARERPDLVRQVVERARREGLRATRDVVTRQLAAETAVGYSSAGRVVEVGGAVSGLSPGDRVACCGGGHANHAELISMPRNLVARVPDSVPMEEAAFATIAAIALHGIRLAEVELGARVAVVGCGLVGQMACRLLACAGARVIALDVDTGRVEDALNGGADHAFVADASAESRVLEATAGIGVDAVIVTAAAASNDPLIIGTSIARDRGAVVLVGAVPIDLPRPPLYDKELIFRVSRSYGPGRYDADYEERGLDYPIGFVRWTEQRNMECVLDLLGRGRLSFAGLIDEIVPVDDAPRAYGRLVAPPEERPRGAIVLAYPQHADERTATQRMRGAVPREARPFEGQPRVGLIGPGSFATRILMPAFVAAGARLELVGGGTGPSAEAGVRTHGFARLGTSEEAVIEDPDVDIVVVATRHGSHARLVEAALAAGKHVFCEKPLALTEAELDTVLDRAASAPGVLAVGFNRRFAPLMEELRAFLAEAAGPVTASYRVSAGRIDSTHWVHELEQGGGRALGEGCHFVDSLRYIVGADIVEVYASGYGAPDTPAQARDNLIVTLSFADRSVGTVVYAADGGPGVAKERLEAFSGSRTAVLDDFRRLELYGANDRASRKLRTQDKGHRREVEAFVAAVKTGRLPVPLAEVENTTLATLAIVRSLQTGAPVRLSG